MHSTHFFFLCLGLQCMWSGQGVWNVYHPHIHSLTHSLTHPLTHIQASKQTHTHTQNDLRITNKSNHIPLGKSCGLTNSRKNSCATVAFSASEVEEANQNWRVRLSWVCFPVCADTRNTRNSSESCAGLLSSSTNTEYKSFLKI